MARSKGIPKEEIKARAEEHVKKLRALTIADFTACCHDVKPPYVEGNFIKGLTYTDDFKKIDYLYDRLTGVLEIWFQGERQYHRKINTNTDFERAVKRVDKKLKRK